MSAETWKSVVDWGTIIFLALTVVTGSAALILGDRINEKQAEHLRKFDEDLTAAKTALSKQQKETAEAQLALQQYVDRVARHQGGRRIEPVGAFLNQLKDKPKGKAEIRYKIDDKEAYWFASEIRSNLIKAGWEASDPVPFAEDFTKGILIDSGITVVAKNSMDAMDHNSLMSALMAAIGFGMGGQFGITTKNEPALEPDKFIILVGQKP
jgi:hypothetical protein